MSWKVYVFNLPKVTGYCLQTRFMGSQTISKNRKSYF